MFYDYLKQLMPLALRSKKMTNMWDGGSNAILPTNPQERQSSNYAIKPIQSSEFTKNSKMTPITSPYMDFIRKEEEMNGITQPPPVVAPFENLSRSPNNNFEKIIPQPTSESPRMTFIKDEALLSTPEYKAYIEAGNDGTDNWGGVQAFKLSPYYRGPKNPPIMNFTR